MKKVKMLGVLAASVLTMAGLASCSGNGTKVEITILWPIENKKNYEKKNKKKNKIKKIKIKTKN